MGFTEINLLLCYLIGRACVDRAGSANPLFHLFSFTNNIFHQGIASRSEVFLEEIGGLAISKIIAGVPGCVGQWCRSVAVVQDAFFFCAPAESLSSSLFRRFTGERTDSI